MVAHQDDGSLKGRGSQPAAMVMGTRLRLREIMPICETREALAGFRRDRNSIIEPRKDWQVNSRIFCMDDS